MPSSASTRVRISSAALLVKVTARMRSGSARPLADEVGDAMGDDARLAGPCAGQDQQRAFGLENSFLLFGIEAENKSIDGICTLPYSVPSSQDGVNRSLFDRDALGEVARLIDVAAAAHGDVIREQLQRNRHDDRRQQRRSSAASARSTSFAGSSIGAHACVALAGDRDHRAAARLGFLHVADHLLEDVVVGRDRHDRHVARR